MRNASERIEYCSLGIEAYRFHGKGHRLGKFGSVIWDSCQGLSPVWLAHTSTVSPVQAIAHVGCLTPFLQPSPNGILYDSSELSPSGQMPVILPLPGMIFSSSRPSSLRFIIQAPASVLLPRVSF